jgi:tetratricopeptide (TPR) repeat protein
MRGFGEAASERWEEAVPFLERFIKYNPGAGFGYRTLSMLYAHTGRVQEARTMLDKGTERWPPTMKNVRFVMSGYPLKNVKVMERFAEGLVKAGLPGKPSDFYKISAENRLAGEELRKLFLGRKISGSNMVTGKKWWIERSEDGKAAIRDGDKSDTGKSWIEEDIICDQWDNFLENLRDCWVIYRNPEGTPENNDEYLGAPGYGIYPFSRVQ